MQKIIYKQLKIYNNFYTITSRAHFYPFTPLFFNPLP